MPQIPVKTLYSANSLEDLARQFDAWADDAVKQADNAKMPAAARNAVKGAATAWKDAAKVLRQTTLHYPAHAFIVFDESNAPGRVLGVYSNEKAADEHIETVEQSASWEKWTMQDKLTIPQGPEQLT